MYILNIIIIIIMVVMLHPGTSASINDDKDLFILNVTMKDYQSTKVMSWSCAHSNEHDVLSPLTKQEDQIIFVQYKLPDEEMTISKWIIRPIMSVR